MELGRVHVTSLGQPIVCFYMSVEVKKGVPWRTFGAWAENKKTATKGKVDSNWWENRFGPMRGALVVQKRGLGE